MAQIDESSYVKVGNPGTFSDFTTFLSSDYEHATRVQKYMEYWRFYKGKHWSYDRAAMTGEPTVTVNYSSAIANRHINFLMKHGFDITMPDIPGTPENESIDRNFVKVMLDETWKRNQKSVWCFEAGQMGSVTGDVFLYFSWEDNDPLFDPYVRVDIIPSHYCFPRLGGPHGKDRKKVEEFTIVFPIYRPRKRALARFGDDSRRMELVMRAEVWTKDTRTVYEGKDIVEGPSPNPFGEIPIVHIPNFPISGEYYGLSDLVNVVDLQQEINEKCTDVSDIINYHSAPLNIIIGAQANQLQRGANRVWFLPDGSQYQTAEMRGDLKANLEYIKMIRQFIFEMSDTPEQALGHNQSKSSQEAAAAMAVDYLPMVDKRETKVALYGNGLRLANRMIIKIQELMDPKFAAQQEAGGLEGSARYLTDVVFPEPFPRNEDLELDRIAKKRQQGLTTRVRALQDLGHGEEDAKKIVAEAMSEQEDDWKRQMQYGPLAVTPGKPGNPNPQRPNPNVQGERRSTTVEKKTSPK